MTKAKQEEYKISEIAANEMFDFAMYTVTARAIPSLYDGLKPSSRFYLYSSLKNSARDFKKVSAISGVLSDYGYQHGEVSAAETGQLMAATWANNLCLVEGRGGFGTRLVQEAGAPRYVYTRVHENFNKYIKDLNLVEDHEDPEHQPPKFYMPVIPLVLVNGSSGIATGYACKILPRSLNDVSKACKEYVTTGKIKSRLPVSFPDFKGTTTYDKATDRYICEGVYIKPTSTKMIISDVPYGFDRKKYVEVLDKLEDAGVIVSYDDQCSKVGFQFEIKLKNTTAKWSHDKIMTTFKLSKKFSENLNVIDHDYQLRNYQDERDLIKDFCDYRLGVLQKRIDTKIADLTEEARWLKVKMEFITAVLDDKIVFKGKKKDAVEMQIVNETTALYADTDKLLRLNIMTLTKEMVDELKKAIKDAKANLAYWKKTTPSDQFISDLDGL